jgi:thiol-disulfide isomerase/thioredoxin
MKTIKLLVAMFFIYNMANAQADKVKLEVGKPMPDFSFEDIKYFKQTKASLKDFKGKWLVLDGWSRYCGVCVRSMPKIDSLQSIFKDKVQFIMVGYTGEKYSKKRLQHVDGATDEVAIKKLYEQTRLKDGLNLVVAFDSLLFHRLDIGPTPYIVIVDPNGIVRGITTKISAKDMVDLMAGREVNLRRPYTSEENKARIKAKYGKSRK